MTYMSGVAFLALPPVVVFTQFLANAFSYMLPTLAVERVFPQSTIAVSTQEATSIVWLGKRSSTIFTPAEYQHLLDVHRIFVVVLALAACCVVVSILTERSVIKPWIAKIYMRIALGIGALTVCIGLGFPLFFQLFHHLFFPQGNYAFPVDSYLIQSFPPAFWLLNILLLQCGVIVGLFLQAKHAEQVGI